MQIEKNDKTREQTEKNGEREKQLHETEVLRVKQDFEDFGRKHKVTSPDNQTGQQTSPARQIHVRSSRLRKIAQKSFSRRPYAGIRGPAAKKFIKLGRTR